MNSSRFCAAALLLVAATFLPSGTQAHRHHHYHRGYHYGLAYPISYLHNYGPGDLPQTFAYYDGSSRNWCYRGAAAYRGQDRQLHPCF
jgi:hypothetical protein